MLGGGQARVHQGRGAPGPLLDSLDTVPPLTEPIPTNGLPSETDYG